MRRLFAVALLLLLGTGVSGQPTTATAPTPRIADLLRDIDSADDAVVDAAVKNLSQLPGASLSDVYGAAEHLDLSDEGAERFTKAVFTIHQRAAALRKKERAATDKQWQFSTGIEAYKSFGHHDPKWDKLAIEALTQNAQGRQDDSFAFFKAAVDMGCDDPLILYYYGLKGDMSARLPRPEALAAFGKSLEKYGKSNYSPSRKLFALVRYARARLQETQDLPQKDADLLRARLADAPDLLRKLPQEHIEADPLLDIGDGLVTAYSWSLANQKAAFDKVFAAMREAYPNSATPLAFAADWYVSWAWTARGSGTADTVTEKGWESFGERLKVAADYVQQAWKTDPTDPRGPTAMITICMAQSAERTEMEMWFARAMATDPDNVRACDAKATYLMPKWAGSDEELMSFGRQCIAFGTARNRIPLVIVRACNNNPRGVPDATVDPSVWPDFRAAYEKILADKSRLVDDHYDYMVDRAELLSWACYLKQWEAVLELSKQFGDEFDMKTFGNKALYDYYKRKAAKELAK